MNRSFFSWWQVAGLGALITGHLLSAQGPLTPPGAPAPTMKTLEQIEPRVDVRTLGGSAGMVHHIKVSGSYYLSGNVTGVTGKAGIYISASEVDLDLNGFRLVGVGGATHGIATDVVRDVRIRDGRVKGWPGVGVYAEEADAVQLERLVIEDCGGEGIFLASDARVANCTVKGCNDGITVGASSRVTASLVKNNDFNGLATGADATVKDVTALGNGRDGVRLGANSRAVGCVTKQNGWTGVTVGIGSVVENCTASSNVRTGIFANARSTIRGSTAVSNSQLGIATGAGCTIGDCTAALNGTDGINGLAATIHTSTVSSNGAYGIRTTSRSTIVGCTATYNKQAGIDGGGHSTIRECSAHANDSDGIRVGPQCYVVGNSCIGNRLAGISVTSWVRIEGNNVAENGYGIRTFDEQNLIIKNRAKDNGTNYWFSGAQVYGSTNFIYGQISTSNSWTNFAR